MSSVFFAWMATSLALEGFERFFSLASVGEAPSGLSFSVFFSSLLEAAMLCLGVALCAAGAAGALWLSLFLLGESRLFGRKAKGRGEESSEVGEEVQSAAAVRGACFVEASSTEAFFAALHFSPLSGETLPPYRCPLPSGRGEEASG